MAVYIKVGQIPPELISIPNEIRKRHNNHLKFAIKNNLPLLPFTFYDIRDVKIKVNGVTINHIKKQIKYD